MEHCIRDAIFHLDKAKEALEASLENPEGWKAESDRTNKLIVQMLPLMSLLSLIGPKIHNPEENHTEENSPSEPVESQSDGYNSEPDTSSVCSTT